MLRKLTFEGLAEESHGGFLVSNRGQVDEGFDGGRGEASAVITKDGAQEAGGLGSSDLQSLTAGTSDFSACRHGWIRVSGEPENRGSSVRVSDRMPKTRYGGALIKSGDALIKYGAALIGSGDKNNT
jgi:hypothetical protein